MAVVDIGSNAIRLSLGNRGLINENQIERYPLRLGHDSFIKGYLSRPTINKFLKVLTEIKYVIIQKKIKHTRFVATSALREARNKEEIISRVFNELGIELELISGVTEAKVLFKAIKEYYTPPPLKQCLIMDIGGGSVELITYKNKKINPSSLKMGTVRLLSQSKVSLSTWDKIILNQLKNNNHYLKKVNKTYNFFGTGGNVKALGKLAYYTGISKRSDILSLNSIKTLLTILASLTYRQRIYQLGLKPDRADVILPATLIICHIMEEFNLSYLNIPRIGLRNGLFLK